MIIPTAMLQQAGLELEAEVSGEDGALVVRAPKQSARSGWAQASAELAKRGDDALIMPDIANDADADLKW